jgi:hypothetical protein
MLNNSNNPVPKLRELKVSREEILDWCQQPATRLFFKSLVAAYKRHQKSMANAYDRESADKTIMKVAEIAGAMGVILDLLNSVHGDQDAQVSLVRQEDVEEAFDDNNV